MKIAFYCPNKPLSHPLPSGDLIIARGIHDALNRLGHDCREVVRFRSRWFWQTTGGWMRAGWSFVFALCRCLRFKPDIWLTYHSYYKSPDILGPWICRLLRIPYLLFQPMYGTSKRKRRETRIGFYLNRIALRAADHAFTNNLDDLEALHRILPADHISYIPPGIFPDQFQRSERGRNSIRERYVIPPDVCLLLAVAMLRRDVKFVSITYLLRSLTHLRSAGINFRLLLVGDGPMEEKVRTLAHLLLPGRVIFAGRVERSDLPAYFSAADIFVFPGIGESLGMVFLEAQACGCPVVALDTAGVPQVVRTGKTGLLAPDDGGQALANAVGSLIKDPARRQEMGAAGIRFIQQQRNLYLNYLALSHKLQQLGTAPPGQVSVRQPPCGSQLRR